MAIPREENARYNSFQEFLSLTKKNKTGQSFTNLYSVRFSTPPMMIRGSGSVKSGKMQVESTDLNWLLDYYADNVNLPSKQITTGQASIVGSPFKYATNTAFSQINISFLMPRSQYTRTFFERWTQLMATDSEQYTRYYNDYVCPQLYIYKWERGGGDIAVSDPKLIRSIRESGNADVLLARKYQLTAAWELQNLYPYNIGSVQLNNSNANTMTLSVGFYYERYRFFTADKFDTDTIQYMTVGSNLDNNTDSSTSNNQSILQSVVNSVLNIF
jgi:hypothetical protein